MSTAEQTVFRSGLMPDGSVAEVSEDVRDYMGYKVRNLVGYIPDAEVAAMWRSYVLSVEELNRHGITDPEDQITLLSHHSNNPLSVPSHIRDIIEGLRQGSQKEYDLRVSAADKLGSLYRKMPSEQARRAEREQQKADLESQRKREEATHMKNQEEAERDYLRANHNLQIAEREYAKDKKQAESTRKGMIALGTTLLLLGIFIALGGATIIGPSLVFLGGALALGPSPKNYDSAVSRESQTKLDIAKLESQICTQRYLDKLA